MFIRRFFHLISDTFSTLPTIVDGGCERAPEARPAGFLRRFGYWFSRRICDPAGISHANAIGAAHLIDLVNTLNGGVGTTYKNPTGGIIADRHGSLPRIGCFRPPLP